MVSGFESLLPSQTRTLPLRYICVSPTLAGARGLAPPGAAPRRPRLTLPHPRRSNAAVPPLNERQWAFLLELAGRIAPGTLALDAAGRDRFRAIVAKALADRPASIRRQFALFLGLLRWAPLLRFGAPFHRLAPKRQDAVLRWFMDAPHAKLRGGMWGLRALVFMGYYAQPETWPAARYAPSFDGNRLLHG